MRLKWQRRRRQRRAGSAAAMAPGRRIAGSTASRLTQTQNGEQRGQRGEPGSERHSGLGRARSQPCARSLPREFSSLVITVKAVNTVFELVSKRIPPHAQVAHVSAGSAATAALHAINKLTDDLIACPIPCAYPTQHGQNSLPHATALHQTRVAALKWRRQVDSAAADIMLLSQLMPSGLEVIIHLLATPR